jgi:hypothetical protein
MKVAQEFGRICPHFYSKSVKSLVHKLLGATDIAKHFGLKLAGQVSNLKTYGELTV